MSTFKGRGVVLSTRDVGESDRSATLLLKEHGKATVSARGARKPKSKLLAGTQLFTYSDFVLFDGGKFYAMAQVDVIESFFSLRNDYETFVLASYFAELCDKYILEGAPCDELLQTLLLSLRALQKGEGKRLARCVFQLKFLQLNGYSPEADLSEMPLLTGRALSPDAERAVEYVLGSAPRDVYKFTVSDAVLREVEEASGLFTRRHLDLKLKSGELLDRL